MAARKKKARAAPQRRKSRTPARKKSRKKAPAVSAVRRRAVNERGTNFGISYRDADLEAGEKTRNGLIAEGVEIPTTWEGIRFFYVTHPEISGYQCAIICRRDWRTYWSRHREEGWGAEREEFEVRLKREALDRIARKKAKQAADGYEVVVSDLEAAVRASLIRAKRDLDATEPEKYETIASQKNEEGVLSQVRRRLPRPSAQHQIALMEKYLEVTRELLGMLDPRSKAARGSGGGRQLVPDEGDALNDPHDQARRAWESQNAMWATELGHDCVDDDGGDDTA